MTAGSATSSTHESSTNVPSRVSSPAANRAITAEAIESDMGIASNCGIPRVIAGVHIYDLRHSFASHAAARSETLPMRRRRPALGSGLIKQRSARQRGGKSGGYRSILIFRSWRKNPIRVRFRQERPGKPECGGLKVCRKAASIMLELSEDQIKTDLQAGRLVKVKDDGQGQERGDDCRP